VTVVSVTVLGCGFMGENHVRAVSEHPTLVLESVVDIDRDRAAEVATEYGANRAFTDYETALDEAEAVIVATPESLHAEQARAALDRDCHLLLEKPLTVELSEAWDLADRATATDVTTGVSFILRYDPGYSGAREAVAEGEIGDPVSVRAKRGVTIEESRRIGGRGHPVYYMNIHDIDAMRWCLDSDVERVRAVERRGELDDVDVPDAMQALFEFENGAIGVLEGYGTLPADTPGQIDAGLDLVGTSGRASVDTPGSTLTVHSNHFDRPDTRHWPVVNGRMDGAVRRQVDQFAAAIDDGGDMLATFEDGARAQTAAAAMKEAAETGESQSVEQP
jgi:predicted dehydrogenase